MPNKRLRVRSSGQRKPTPEFAFGSTTIPYYGNGSELTLPRQVFQMLYREVGFEQAVQIGVDDKFVLWPHNPPPLKLLKDWAVEVDMGIDGIPIEVEAAFKKRWDNYAKSMAITIMRGAKDAHIQISKTTRDVFQAVNEGKEVGDKQFAVLEKLTAMAPHMHNAFGYISEKYFVVPRAKETAASANINFMLNAGEPPKRSGGLRRTNGKPDRRSIPSPKAIAAAIPQIVEVNVVDG